MKYKYFWYYEIELSIAFIERPRRFLYVGFWIFNIKNPFIKENKKILEHTMLDLIKETAGNCQ